LIVHPVIISIPRNIGAYALEATQRSAEGGSSLVHAPYR